MTTKDFSLPWKQGILNNNTSNGQFNSLNLNQSHRNSTDAFSETSKSPRIRNGKGLDYDLERNIHSQTKKDSHSWNKSSNFGSNIYDSEIEGKLKKQQNSSVNSSSTLSLHIEAYESSIDYNQFNKTKESVQIGNGENAKQILTSSTFTLQNPFEFPRQQENFGAKKPEVARYKATQRLLNPNQGDRKMHLYHLSLQQPTSIVCAVQGCFSGISKQQEICVARGSVLQLLVCDSRSGKVTVRCSQDCFGILRSLLAFKLTGGTKDYIVVGSDSGRFVILEYNPTKNTFDRVHQETYGKTGCRRIVPGEYLAADPKGRAVLVGAVERQKLVYIMNRDAQANLTISSPLEAHRSYSICYAVIGLDVGFENPTFACLEVEYEEADQDPTGETAKSVQQSLTFYELDLGLNHVVRKYSEPLQERGNHLIPVPGGADGPSGVIVCCENVIVYKNLGDQPDIRVMIPRRQNDLEHENRPLMVIASASHKTKSIYFFLIQIENGDLFKVTLDTEGDIVTDMHLKYFDTVSPANSMCILKTGFLFVAAEFGNHQLYQIARLGSDDAEGDFSSRSSKPGLYNCRDLYNLVLVDTVDSLDPLTHTVIADLAGEDAPQIYALCGQGGRSTLRVLRNGLEVSEMAISELPGNPQNVWTVRRTVDDTYHSYIVVSFANATLVLAIQESIEEVPDSGFLGTAPTIGCGLIGDDSLLQVYPGGLRHIKSDRRINEWKAPSRRHIVNCAINRRQVIIALSGGEIVYFELDMTNQLREFSERRELPADVLCMSVSDIPEGELRSRFLTVGLSDRTVRVISLDPADCLSPLSMQAVQADPSSLLIIETPDEGGSTSMMHMNIGLANGCLMRTTIDQVTGELADTRLRYLGTRPVSMFKIIVQGRDAVIATSSRSWVLYHYQNRFHLTPLSYMALDSASSFVSPQCSEGIVAVARSTLRILALDKLGAVFNQTSHKLKFTPRGFVPLFHSDHLIVIETDHAAFTEKAKKERRQALMEGTENVQGAHELRALYQTLNNDESKFGAPRNHNGTWASSIRLIHANRGNTLCHFELPDGEAAFCVEVVHFRSQPEALFVLVGCASNLQLVPHHKPKGGCVYTFLVHKNGQGFEFIHGTPTDEPVYAIHAFKGVVLVGCGQKLRLYDMGKRRLLKKCENKQIPYNIVDVKSIGGRIIVSDVQESIHFLRYRASDNRMIVFADETTPRYIRATCILDYDTVAVGDRFGNISVLRLPKDVTDDVQDDPTGVRALYDRGNLNGAPQKIELISQFYVGSMITTLQKTNLVPGAEDALVYTTITGAIGMFVPFVSRDEYELFQTLEMHMRVEFPPLCGRDHLAYRSFYAPIKNVVDGDMCEQYGMIEPVKQREIGENLGRKATEVAKKLEDMRTRYAF